MPRRTARPICTSHRVATFVAPGRVSTRREFHVCRAARERYGLEGALFSLRGNVIFADFRAARVFAQSMNDRRDLLAYPERAVRASHVNAMGLIDEILHVVAALYREQRSSDAMAQALRSLDEQLGREAVDAALAAFVDEFPSADVYSGAITAEDWLGASTGGEPHREAALEELLLLWLANANPAFAPFLELFDDRRLRAGTAYHQVVDGLDRFFAGQPNFGPDGQSLVEMLRSPAKAAPHSLEGQLEFIRTRWGALLGDRLYRLLGSLDMLAEEQRATFGVGGSGPVAPYDFGGLDPDEQRYSPDSDWMPRVVLLAKSVHVWLDQLSKRYDRMIERLDQVPDEELDTLARWGFTGLWLIGVWQRSPASARIKKAMGNPEAAASAYSLTEYRVADDLGGEAAFEDLANRAAQRGIRMAADMVPNHTGIDSRWVVEHPDWFVGLDHSPFPGYTFSGPDLSDHPDVGIFLEDHYYDRSDAAVVFKRVDRRSGSERFIYHGNDGTSMPWNDTAQLNFLNPEVREAVIQTILEVARKARIIRFDAAMTLTKRHYQRLWFPEPGSGGDIPSRADFGMRKADFDQAMPAELWREVVDRVAQEAPDTLLLAEAFWLLEGYFVRTLGMHRVYNSAFMNMLRDERNQDYRTLIKNTLEFDPQILKRYVNFMNNPDERTAVDQFGKGDKYFGICTLMATLPGLPMFGHGQVEGLEERYGMEYRRAYWDEAPDQHLIERHERQLFPLLHRRHLFAEVDDFLLYDFTTTDGAVDENVFAYSNRCSDDRALVVFHNRYAETRGHILTSVDFKDGGGRLVRRTLAEGLSIPDDPGLFLVFRDATAGLEYIRSCSELAAHGLWAELQAFTLHVFVDFREVRDTAERPYAELCRSLAGRAVPSIDGALRQLALAPVHAAARRLLSGPALTWLAGARPSRPGDPPDAEVLTIAEGHMEALLRAAAAAADAEADQADLAAAWRERLEAALELFDAPPAAAGEAPAAAERRTLSAGLFLGEDSLRWGVLLAALVIRPLGEVIGAGGAAEQSRAWVDEWLLGSVVADALGDLGADEATAWRAVAAVKVLVTLDEALAQADGDAHRLLSSLLRDEAARTMLRVNRHQGSLWFSREGFEELLGWMLMADALRPAVDPGDRPPPTEEVTQAMVLALYSAMEKSNFTVEGLLEKTADAPATD